MPISPTMVLRYIKRKLGTITRAIPITDNQMLEVIYQDSLYTYSNYFPYIVHKCIGIKDMDKHTENLFYLSTKNDELEILGVSKIFRRGQGYYGTDSGYPIMSASNIFEAQLATDMISMTVNPDSYKFWPPNKIEIFPKLRTSENIMVELKTVHPKSLNTIPLSMKDEFFELCELDINISIFEILQLVDDASTAYGNIQLKLDKFQNAEEKKKELLERWNTNFMKQSLRRKIYIM